ncbi:MAG TPA: hypothetical protein VH761_09800 [Ilumatobacteraceae bacterium]
MNLGAIAAGRGDPGLPLGADLVRFASAAASVRGDRAEMTAAREALINSGGKAVMIDAAAVAANFHMMTRLADGTGARYPATRLEEMAPVIDEMGASEMSSRRSG